MVSLQLNYNTLFITFTTIALSPSPVPFSPQQLFTTVAVISFVRRETVLYFMIQLMKISDFSVAIKRIQVSTLFSSVLVVSNHDLYMTNTVGFAV